MKSKSLFTKTCLGLLIFTSLIVGCKNKNESNISSPKGDFNGLYTVEYENSDIQYVWIFSDDTRYVLYPGSTSNYLDDNKSISWKTIMVKT